MPDLCSGARIQWKFEGGYCHHSRTPALGSIRPGDAISTDRSRSRSSSASRRGAHEQGNRAANAHQPEHREGFLTACHGEDACHHAFRRHRKAHNRAWAEYGLNALNNFPEKVVFCCFSDDVILAESFNFAVGIADLTENCYRVLAQCRNAVKPRWTVGKPER